LKAHLDTEYKVVTGKDYLKWAKNPSVAKTEFIKHLKDARSNIIFVTAEKDDLSFVPSSVKRVLFKAPIDTKIERFSKRFNGHLPEPVAAMLKRKDGMFDAETHDLEITDYHDKACVVNIITSEIAL